MYAERDGLQIDNKQCASICDCKVTTVRTESSFAHTTHTHIYIGWRERTGSPSSCCWCISPAELCGIRSLNEIRFLGVSSRNTLQSRTFWSTTSSPSTSASPHSKINIEEKKNSLYKQSWAMAIDLTRKYGGFWRWKSYAEQRKITFRVSHTLWQQTISVAKQAAVRCWQSNWRQ